MPPKSVLTRGIALVAICFLLSGALLSVVMHDVKGQIGVDIYSIYPPTLVGKVGELVSIQGSTETRNGTYQIWFGNSMVYSATAEGYYVNASFPIPELPAGNYTITLSDLSAKVNATREFNLIEAYSIKAMTPEKPAQLQEGSTVTLNVTVTAGQPSTKYYANITVVLPGDNVVGFSRLVELTTSNLGTAQAQIVFPNSALFQPSGSNTYLPGVYTAYFNMSENLASSQFTIGITDMTEYHRQDRVSLHAEGYAPSEKVSVSIKYAATGASYYSESATASAQGVITSSWAVPSNAPVGEYTVTLTGENTMKSVSDTQNFFVTGYNVSVRALNLAGEPVPQVLLQVLDKSSNETYNGTTDSSGIASFNLEKGSHILTAFWNKNFKVGETEVTVYGSQEFNITCKLTNLEIQVKNQAGIPMPFVTVNVTYQYTMPVEGKVESGAYSGTTDLNGVFRANSTLPGIAYRIVASRYGVVFNSENDTVSSLPEAPVYHVTVVCPSVALTIKTLDYNGASLADARLELIEQASGLLYSVTTDSSGTASLSVTLGRYRVRVYAGSFMLNETTMDALKASHYNIRCMLYNLKVSVKVTDYFGQPMPNVNVVLNHDGLESKSNITRSDGVAVFDGVVGGNLQVKVYLTGHENSFVLANVYVDSPTQIPITLSMYTTIGSYVIETRVLIMLLLILMTTLFFVGLEFYVRWHRSKSKTPITNQ